MIDFLLTIAAFLVAISLLIAVHEFGHYWVARRLGVKVLRFSLGFGKPLLRRFGKDADRVEYVISSIPLGGYVKMLDEREGEVAPEELHRAFNRQPVAKRFAIVAAGPLFNLVFAVFAYWLMFMNGVPGLKPELGVVPEGTLAAMAGLHQGELIVGVDGTETLSWGDVLEKVLPKALLREPVTLEVSEGAVRRERTLPLDRLSGDEKQDQLMDIIGLKPYRVTVTPLLEAVVAGSVAEQAGLHPGDLITAVAGVATPQWVDLVAEVSKHPNQPVVITYQREGVSHEVTLVPKAETVEGKVVGRIGVGPVIPAYPERLIVEVRYGPVESIGQAAGRVWDNVTVTLQMMREMIVGRVSVENLSGPITIATYAKTSAMAGLSEFLRFLAIVSLSLGVLNLLPIPVLDGGHLAFYLVEMVKGSPVSERTEAIGQRIGLALILAMMTLALYNDLVRVAGRIFPQ
ncbi:MAG TPA: RIP metalloprotease RseP [Gammaproteobacteria bacterium]